MSALQTDPKVAMAKYGHLEEMRTFMHSFMKLLGDHFTGIGTSGAWDEALESSNSRAKA